MIELSDPNERRIGPFTVVGTLARGATSEVVRAIDPDLNRIVAIKLLSKDFVKDAEALARFERESRVVTRLDHPNIARILETGVSLDGQPYFVMQYVDGRSLREMIDDKIEMPMSRQIDLIVQAAEGLRAALNQKMIHRDIKPANLMVDPDWRLKIVDFGLVKVIGEETYKTVAGRVMGTPRYMAPEVALGRPGDYRSDIYSLGATFYHLLTGQPPFDGETPAAVMMQHVHSPLTPPYLLNPQIPVDVCEVVEKAMAKDPNHRYQGYEEIIADLNAAKIARMAKEQRGERLLAAEEEKRARRAAPVVAEAAQERREAAEERREEKAATREIRRPPSYLTEGKVVTVPESQPASAGGGGRRMLLFVLLFLLGVAGLAYLSVEPSAGSSPGGLSAFLQALVSRLGKGETPQERYYGQYATSVKRLGFLNAAIREYLVAAGKYPEQLSDLVDKQVATEQDLLDGFGGQIRYDRILRRLRAAGPDRILDNSDDFLVTEDGRMLNHPPEPEKKAQDEFLDVEGIGGEDVKGLKIKR